jgi:hypothetical protein
VNIFLHRLWSAISSNTLCRLVCVEHGLLPYIFTNLVLHFYIKLNIKIPNFPTIQTHVIRQFSVSGFVPVLKPNAFDVSNYKRWPIRMILWLTAMSCYHIAIMSTGQTRTTYSLRGENV